MTPQSTMKDTIAQAHKDAKVEIEIKKAKKAKDAKLAKLNKPVTSSATE